MRVKRRLVLGITPGLWSRSSAALQSSNGNLVAQFFHTSDPENCRQTNKHYCRGEGSVGSLPSNGAPVPDEPANSHRPSGNVTSRPFALFAPPLESWDFA